MGIGGTPSAFKLDVNGTQRINGNLTIDANSSINTPSNTNSIGVFGGSSFNNGSYFSVFGNNCSTSNGVQKGSIQIFTDRSTSEANGGTYQVGSHSAGSVFNFNFIVFKTGNTWIGTQAVGTFPTDAGFKLDVNGTARVTQMTFPATIDKKIFLYEGITDYAIGLAAGAIRLGTPAGNRVAMGNYTGATFTEICNVSPTGLNLLSGRVDLGADTSNVKLAIYTSAGISMGLGVSAATFRFSAGGTTNNFVFFDDAAGNKLYSLISLTGAGYYGSGTVNASAQLQVDSTTRGFLPPRMTTTQKNAIATPATGLMVYDTTLNLISVYNGTTWISL